ncbi:MAG: aminodeoxychorismate synthase component I [Acidimicrobiia bacterium]|nr:aminodeoxychorismate synthase component I [Acidimicrobiia bacterium]
MPFSARLDDLRPNRRRSAGFSEQVGEIAAHSLAEAVHAIDAVEAATRDGLWAVGFVGYDAAPAFDRNLVVPTRNGFQGMLPLVWFGLYRTRTLNPGPAQTLGAYELTPWEWVDTRYEYERDVATIREHIAAGDTYQVNYTSRLRSRFSGDPIAFYHDLAAAQSGGYGTYIDTGRFQIVSASPELFFDRYPIDERTDRLITRPMKGTARRGRWESEDAEQRALLEASGKDRAENLIIVDLLRNDLGRVAQFGTVAATDLMRIERFDTVWQMTSTIEAEVGAEVPLRDVFTALFPCGSITGAPKVRTMQIISELESSARGVYTGAIGFVSPPGVRGPRASFSVGIRTVVIDGETGEAEYGVGGGITWDSEPRREYAEAALKAEILRYGRTDFALLETMRWNPVGGWYWLDYHLDRLGASADYFGIPFDRLRLRDRLEAAVEGGDDLRVRLTLDRRGRASVTVALPPRADTGSVAVAVDHEPVDVRSPFLFHKTTRREVYEERSARHPHVGDVLLVNGDGELTESTIANVVVKLDGDWYTPPIEAGCLPGIYRRVLLEEGRISERRIPLADLQHCEGIALINSVRLWRPAFIVDG